MGKTYRSEVRKLFNSLKLDRMVINYFVETVTYCHDNNVGPADVMLTKHFYPVIERKYKKTKYQVESECIGDIARVWIESDKQAYHEVLNYTKKKPTIKKIILLALIAMKEKGME